MSRTCWSEAAMLQPGMQGGMQVITYINTLPAGCQQICESDTLCEGWTWKSFPAYNANCALLQDDLNAGFSIDSFSEVGLGDIAFSRWRTVCNHTYPNSILEQFYLSNLPGGFLHTWLFGATNQLGVSDPIMESSSNDFLSSAEGFDYRAGVSVSDDQSGELMLVSHVQGQECEYLCTSGGHSKPCVAFSWEQSDKHDTGECRLFSECPSEELFQAYKVDIDGFSKLVSNLDAQLKSTMMHHVGPGSTVVDLFEGNRPVVTAMKSGTCKFPDNIKRKPLSILYWVLIGLAAFVGVAIIITLIVCCAKR